MLNNIVASLDNIVASLEKSRFLIATFVLSLFALSGCGKSNPIVLPVEHQDLYGVWEKVEIKDNGLIVDNALLAFHQDNTVTYITCEKKSGFQSSKSLPGFVLVRFEGKQLDIQSDIWFGTWTEHIVIDRFPYQSLGQTYIQANGKSLRKLLDSDQTDFKNWPCQKESHEKESKNG